MLIEQKALIGDAWLKIVLVDAISHKFPSATVGQLTTVANSILSNQHLASLISSEFTGTHANASIVEALAYEHYRAMVFDVASNSSFSLLVKICDLGVKRFESEFAAPRNSVPLINMTAEFPTMEDA